MNLLREEKETDVRWECSGKCAVSRTKSALVETAQNAQMVKQSHELLVVASWRRENHAGLPASTRTAQPKQERLPHPPPMAFD